MARVTMKILENQVYNLNRLYKLNDNTNMKFSLSGAYGGWKLVMKSNNTGAEHNINYGYESKKVVSDILDGLINTKNLVDRENT